MNNFDVAVIRGRDILSKWRNDIKTAVCEGETTENAHIIIKPTTTRDPQKVAMFLVHFVPVEMTTIKSGEMLMKEEWQKEANGMTLAYK
jgi:hypothetical protein